MALGSVNGIRVAIFSLRQFLFFNGLFDGRLGGVVCDLFGIAAAPPQLFAINTLSSVSQSVSGLFVVVWVEEPVMKNQSASGAEEASLIGTGAMRSLTAP